MSDNEAHGSIDIPERNYSDSTDATYDTASVDPAKKGTPKWVAALIAVPAVLVLIGTIFGESLPKCDSSTSRGMIEDLFLQVPLNTAQSTVVDLTAITETGYDEAAKTRICQARLLDSAGVEHSVAWVTIDRGETYNYELEVKG